MSNGAFIPSHLSAVKTLLERAQKSNEELLENWPWNKVNTEASLIKWLLQEAHVQISRISSVWCTEYQAAWCPVCGDCTCDRRPSNEQLRFDNPECPLHGKGSKHPIRPATPAAALEVALDYSEQFSRFDEALIKRVTNLPILSDWKPTQWENVSLADFMSRANGVGSTSYSGGFSSLYVEGEEQRPRGGRILASKGFEQRITRWACLHRHALDGMVVGPAISRQSNIQNETTGFRLEALAGKLGDKKRDTMFFGSLNEAMRFADKELIDAGYLPANARCLYPKSEAQPEPLEQE